MPILLRAIISGVLIVILGLALMCSFDLMGVDPEKSVGLSLLFKLRGTRSAPSEVVIISLDKSSADHFNLPVEPRKWPRTLYARLTENLVQRGAAVIAFDILFEESRSQEDDEIFALAIQNAGNVVLCECLRKDIFSFSDAKGPQKSGVIHLETIEPPLQCLAESALALAPFPLPKVPITVSQYWTFKTAAGGIPSLPVVVYQVFALAEYDTFFSFLKTFAPVRAQTLPPNKDALVKAKNVENIVRSIRDIIKQQSSITSNILDKTALLSNRNFTAKKSQRLISLTKMYQSPDSHFINFYGPPGTITTIPFYHLFIDKNLPAIIPAQVDLSGKAVFVGLSGRLRPEQKDGFHTVYSQPDGVDISGVEIAATAFANLLEDKPLRRVLVRHEAFILVLCGLFLGLFCHAFSAGISLASVLAFSGLYLLFVWHQFSQAAIWWPVVLPLFFQAPLAFFGNLCWKYLESNKERNQIKIALGYYLPNQAANQVTKNIMDFKATRKVINGTCLLTDAGRYTTLSDTLDPMGLSNFMNKYYEALFDPVKVHSGMIVNIVGDSMLALWEKKTQDIDSQRKACFAALDIIDAVYRFNQSSGNLALPIRIGIDSGRIILSNVGALDHYEFRPTGPAINTASRLEGLNKVMKTTILVSDAALNEDNDFLARKLGVFLLKGKTVPTAVSELMCRKGESTEPQRTLCSIFSEGLQVFRGKSWDKAAFIFKQGLKVIGDDGPTQFYLELCRRFRENPPDEGWDGLISIDQK